MKLIKRIISLTLSLITVSSVALSASIKAESEYYDSWLDFNADAKTVSGIPLGAKAESFEMQIKNADGDILSGKATVSTGCIINYNGQDYSVIVLGDVNGDGSINSTDFMQVRRQYLGLYDMNDIMKKAADVNGDGKINSTDFMQIRKHYLGLYTIPNISFSKLLENSVAAKTSLTLIEQVCKDYYSLDTHILQNDLQSTWGTTLWPFGSFMEALTETYKLYPENETIKKYLLDALDNGLNNFKVTTDLTTPAGEFKNITYYNASAFNRGDYYYDDNAWICIQLLEAYELFGDEKYLTKAEEILAFFETGIDDTVGGGLYWDKTFKCKNTCADGPAAIGYLRAYQYTGNEHYLNRGRELVDWLNKTLRDTDGLYFDNIEVGSNAINSWKAFYNQGTPMYAMCLLYEITGEAKYKTLLDETANSALKHTYRTVWDGGLKTTLNGNPIYKSWCIGWLIRGFEEYVTLTGEGAEFYEKLHPILLENLETKDGHGYYDPYFRTGHYSDQSKTEVLQTSGVTSIYALYAYYEVHLAPTM